MKIKYSFYIVTITVLLTGCLQKEKGTLRIDSLSVYGTEFYCNQNVKLWMCVESDNLYIAEYEWGCDAGRFEEELFSEACWVTPNIPGEYTVWCKVTIGKNTETRYRKLNVSHYFFEYFKDGTVWTGQSGTTRTLKKDEDGNGYWEFQVNSATAATQYINYSFANDASLKAPFSCRATIGHITNMPKDSVTVGTARAANTLGYQLITDREANYTGLYIDQINFVWYPVGSDKNIMPIDPVSGEKCNGRFSFRQAGSGATRTYSYYLYHSALNFAEKEYKKVGLNISADYIVTVYVAGEEVFNTDALKNWRSDNNYTGAMRITEWRVPIPNGNGNTNITTFYFSNTIADNTGIVYTGAASELPNP